MVHDTAFKSQLILRTISCLEAGHKTHGSKTHHFPLLGLLHCVFGCRNLVGWQSLADSVVLAGYLSKVFSSAMSITTFLVDGFGVTEDDLDVANGMKV